MVLTNRGQEFRLGGLWPGRDRLLQPTKDISKPVSLLARDYATTAAATRRGLTLSDSGESSSGFREIRKPTREATIGQKGVNHGLVKRSQHQEALKIEEVEWADPRIPSHTILVELRASAAVRLSVRRVMAVWISSSASSNISACAFACST